MDKVSSEIIFQAAGIGTGVGVTDVLLTTPISKPTTITKNGVVRRVTKLGGATPNTTLGSRLFGQGYRNAMKRPFAKLIGQRAASTAGKSLSKAVPLAGWALIAWDAGAAYYCRHKCLKKDDCR